MLLKIGMLNICFRLFLCTNALLMCINILRNFKSIRTTNFQNLMLSSGKAKTPKIK